MNELPPFSELFSDARALFSAHRSTVVPIFLSKVVLPISITLSLFLLTSLPGPRVMIGFLGGIVCIVLSFQAYAAITEVAVAACQSRTPQLQPGKAGALFGAMLALGLIELGLILPFIMIERSAQSLSAIVIVLPLELVARSVLSARFYVQSSVVIAELPGGFGSVRRTWQLSKGYGSQLFAKYLLMSLVTLCAGMLTVAVFLMCYGSINLQITQTAPLLLGGLWISFIPTLAVIFLLEPFYMALIYVNLVSSTSSVNDAGNANGLHPALR